MFSIPGHVCSSAQTRTQLESHSRCIGSSGGSNSDQNDQCHQEHEHCGGSADEFKWINTGQNKQFFREEMRKKHREV